MLLLLPKSLWAGVVQAVADVAFIYSQISTVRFS